MLPTKALYHNDTTLTKQGEVKMVGTMPGLCYVHTSQGPPFNLGDPRSNYYLKATQWDRAYVGDSSWGGQVYMKSVTEKSNWADGESRVAGWADGGHNFSRGTTPTATPSKLTDNPTTFAEQAPDATKVPARISNDGSLHSITELSYIYDPFQWTPFSGTPASAKALDTTWRNAWQTKFVAADATYGSHSTLRIGRPEFAQFDTNGTRASNLLDVFSISDQTGTSGRINLNTASRETLRALGAGIQIGNLSGTDVDQAIQPSTVYGPMKTTVSDSFADAVITARATQPFLTTSQLAQLKATDKNGKLTPFFGNADQWTNNDGPTVETTDNYPTVQTTSGSVDWNDAASEEYFGKLFNFATVRSRNFRVFVTGQVYDKTSNQVYATANKVYEVYLEPTRDPNSTPPGNITGQTCEVTYAANLPQ
jgi:hypothetical protein